MKMNASVAGLLTATMLTAVVTGEVVYKNKDKEKEVVSNEDITITEKNGNFYANEHSITGDSKNLINDINGSGNPDSGDLEHKENIIFLSNGLTEVRTVDYPSVKTLIDYLDQLVKYDVSYDNFKNISNHEFDLCMVESISRWADYENDTNPLYYVTNIYYNNKLIYTINHQYVAKDKDGNLIYLEGVNSADSIKTQGIDVNEASETTMSYDDIPKVIK